ncbi:DNA methyltransferase [Mycolicibacterium sp.]|uniref:DNA methyltransferase n=1 Tax=Mycolicibacterium sp. TaxID=2320850 RepID=UPI0037C6A5D1
MKPYYADDQVTLYHGDCLEITDWLAADVLVTDPPYGRAWRQGDLGPAHPRNAASLDGIANDADTTVRDRALHLWGSNRPAMSFGDLTLAPPAGVKLTAVYQKDNTCGLRGAIGGVRRDAEAIYFLGKGWGSGIGGRSSVFITSARVSSAAGIVARHGGHPHTKPGDVMEQLLELCPDGVVADPFAGSGSTLVAARNLGRKAIGVELEERYCELIAKRLDQMALDFGAMS